MSTVDKVFVKILYEGKNISEDISAFIISFNYTDNVRGKADEVEISLNDQQGLFSGSWYPDKKAKISCEIQYKGKTLNCGTFYIGEISISGPPDVVTWHATSVDPNSKLRTKNSKGYNKVSLLEIAKQIAGAHNLTVQDDTGTIKKVKIDRKTQNNETDLYFLSRLAKDHGLAFNIKPPKLIFYSEFALADTNAVVTIDKAKVTSYSFTDKINDTYSDVQVSSHNPNTNSTIQNGTELQNTAKEQGLLLTLASQAVDAGLITPYAPRLASIRNMSQNNDAVLRGLSAKGFGEEFDALNAAYSLLFADKSITACIRYSNFCKELRTKLLKTQAEGNKVTIDKDAYTGGQSANVLKIKGKVETKEQADVMAKAALYNKNSKTKTGNFTLEGNLLYVAGNNFNATGFGRSNGKYSIVTSTHSIGGEYTVSLEFKTVPVKK